MKYIKKAIYFITNLERAIASITLTVMMFFTAVAVILRSFSKPIVGDYELTELFMLILIMTSLGYAERDNKHISIGIIVDRFPNYIQSLLNIIARMLTLIFCIIVSLIFLLNLIKNGETQSTELLRISFLPFKLLIVIGFLSWGLESLIRVASSLKDLLKKDGNEGGDGVHVD